MSKLKIKAPGQNLQIRSHLSFGESWDPRQREVLENVHPAGFMRLETIHGRKALFAAPADVPLDRYISNGMDRVSFYIAILQFVNVQRQIEHHHLNPANLQMDPKWIFVNCRTKEMFFLYQPLALNNEISNPRPFLAALAGAAAGYGTENQAIEELRNLIMMSSVIRNSDLEALVVRYMPQMQSDFVHPDGGRLKSTMGGGGTLTMDDYVSASPTGTVVMDDQPSGSTTILDENQYREPVYVGVLTRKRTGETIRVDRDVFRLGSSSTAVDYRITGNPAISRTHADLISRSGKFYIYDTNSTNGSFLRGQRLPSMQETELTDGDIIRLANEDFDFQIIQE